VQIDRIEVGVWGFGKEDELWLIDYAVLPGDPYKPDVWKSLDEFRNNTYTHESGAKIRIRLLAVDAGNWAKEVLEFCAKSSHNCIPIRGSNRTQLALCQKSKDATYPVYWIATDIAKDIIFSRFKVTEPGPRYIHIPEWATQDICAQLTNEERKEYKRAGITSTHWMPKGSSLRVESLDILVYALALFDATPFPKNMDSIFTGLTTVAPQPAETQPQPQQGQPQQGHRIIQRSRIITRGSRF
jgi:phage terminase large subunit GpA-like protein